MKLILTCVLVGCVVGCSRNSNETKPAKIETTNVESAQAVEVPATSQTAQEYASKATLALGEGRSADAKDLLEKALAIKPSVSEYRVGLALAYFQLEDEAKAKENLHIALEQTRQESATNSLAYMQQSMILYLLNRKEEAEQILEKPELESLMQQAGGKENFLKELQQMTSEMKGLNRQ